MCLSFSFLHTRTVQFQMFVLKYIFWFIVDVRERLSSDICTARYASSFEFSESSHLYKCMGVHGWWSILHFLVLRLGNVVKCLRMCCD